MNKIAILGATGHIAQSLIPYYVLSKDELYLFSRRHDYLSYFELFNYKFDMIINCTGAGVNLKNKADYFELNSIDDLCIHYLQKNKETLYVNLSSGILEYDKDIKIKPENYYYITKLYQEAKHRALVDLMIIDLRIYSYLSEYINLNDNYFICDLFRAVKEGKEFITSGTQFTRDYLSSIDLYNFIIRLNLCNNSKTLGSKEPVKKEQILDYFICKYNLKVKKEILKTTQPTGQKINYYPIFTDNNPSRTSIETIINTANILLK